MKYLDYSSLLSGEPAHLALFSTFQFDPDFFERRLLKCAALQKARRIAVFMDAVQTFLPVALQFEPDVVAVSAGFDAHLYDPLLDLRVTAGSFYAIGQILRENFKNIFATLEGGYSIEQLPKCIRNFAAGVNGIAMPCQQEPTTTEKLIREEYDRRVSTGVKALSPYWKF